MQKLVNYTLLCSIVITVYPCTRIARAEFNRNELRAYYAAPGPKAYYSRCLTEPEAFKSSSMKFMQAIGSLPADAAAADVFADTLLHLDTLLCEHVYQDKRISLGESDFLQNVYANTCNDYQLRGRAGLLLYLQTDKIGYLIATCQYFKTRIAMFAEVYDNNFPKLLSHVVARSFDEQVSALAEALQPDAAEFSQIIALNYIDLVRAIHKHHLSESYLNYLFENTPYFVRFSARADPLYIARELRAFSVPYTKIFLESLMEGDEIDMLARIADSDEELARMIVAVASEKSTKYGVIKEAALDALERLEKTNEKQATKGANAD